MAPAVIDHSASSGALSIAEEVELDTLRTTQQDDSPPSQDTRPMQYPTGARFIFITLGLILSIFLTAVDSTVVTTAIPSITDEFGSISNIAWYGSAYAVTNTAVKSSWGKAYDYFDLKYVFILTMIIFEIGNVICAAAPNSSTLILGRVVAGIGGGGLMTGAFIMVALTAKPKYRVAYFGVLGVTFAVAGVVGPLMGGALTDGPGWRWCFWINLPIGFVAAIIMILFFTPPVPPKPATLREKMIRMDLLGATLATGCLSSFVLAMHWTGVIPWSDKRIVLSFVGFCGLGVLFVLNEWWMGSKAMIQHHLVKKRSVAVNLMYSFCLAGVYFPLLYSLPIQFQSINNASASQSGVRLIPLILGISVFTMVANGILTWWRHYNPLLVAGAIVGTAGVSLIYTLDMHASTASWIGYEIVASTGIGISLQIPMIANQAAVPAEDIAAATSLSLFAENLGTCLFIAATEAAFTNGLLASLRNNIPKLDSTLVLNAGATQLRNLFSGAELEQVLESYLNGCKVSHIVSIAAGVAACMISFASAGPGGIREIKARWKKPHEP